ncbi:hypothetical protein ID866_13034, partial [Astraeus odoratus]
MPVCAPLPHVPPPPIVCHPCLCVHPPCIPPLPLSAPTPVHAPSPHVPPPPIICHPCPIPPLPSAT